MKDKINIAELLKDCPTGMELGCIMCNSPIALEGVVGNESTYPIRAVGKDGFHHMFTCSGGVYDNEDSKCVIFPKGKTTWEGFVPPCNFKDGDIIYIRAAFEWVAIYKENNSDDIYKYVSVRVLGDVLVNDCCSLCYKGDIREIRHATEEEKQKLFDAIKSKGYRWNAETKTLEKLPKFKVGDRIQNKKSPAERTIKICEEDGYWTTIHSWINISSQDEWELIPNRFDINTLKPFESRVLVRDGNTEKWKSNFWGFYDIDHAMNYPYECCGSSFAQCIPYEGNEHLFGKTDDCSEYYKTWK